MFIGVNMIRASLTVAIVLAGFVFSTPSEAQWAWKDANGRTVYSDRPPPPDIKAGSIVRQPNTQTLANPAPASGPLDDAGKPADGKGADAKGTPNAPKTVAEREMEFRKRQQERAEGDKKANEEQAKSAAKTAECERARGYMKSLEDGIRITRTDASGNREFLDDSQRAAEVDRTRKIIQSTCS